MSKCGGKETTAKPVAACRASAAAAGPNRAAPAEDHPLAYFGQMIPHCLAYAQEQHALGRPIVGILCEYTPRELILAAGAVPVCLCGGSAAPIHAAEAELPANLCPLIKSTYGYHALKSNPFLEMASLIVAETTCDGKKKMYELMGRTRPMHVVSLPPMPDSASGLAYWEQELRRLKVALEVRLGVTIADAALRDAIALMNRERALRRGLAALMKRDAPPLTGRELLEFKSSISGIPQDLAQYERALAVLAAEAPRTSLAGRVRVLLTGVPVVHGAERVVNIVEDHGGLIVCMENCTGIKPIIEDVDAEDPDPIRALARKYYRLPCSVMSPNDARLDSIRALAVEYRAQCVVDLIWHACLTYDVESGRVRQLAEEELGLPYLRIETDYSPADTARIAVRVEALFETVRARDIRDRNG